MSSNYRNFSWLKIRFSTDVLQTFFAYTLNGEESHFLYQNEKWVLYREGCKQRRKVMNPNMRIHEKLVIECHQGSQHDKRQHSLTLNQRCSEMSATELAAHCVRELNNFRRGEPCTERYGVELLRRATVQGDQEAWAWVQHCFGAVVLNWLRRHPQRAHAGRLESEENYVAQAFERFWQATTSNKRVEFHTRAAALHYLRASRNGDILDTMRAYLRPRETSLPEPGEQGAPSVKDSTASNEVWEILQTMLPDR